MPAPGCAHFWHVHGHLIVCCAVLARCAEPWHVAVARNMHLHSQLYETLNLVKWHSIVQTALMELLRGASTQT